MKRNGSKTLRERVAREAALLLYSSQEKEYKQAKKRAAEILKTRMLPSNREIAEELDRIADDREGAMKSRLLLRMRMEAQKLMGTLKNYNPRLVGSVWRGTARQNSDIDILVYSQDALQVLSQIQNEGFMVPISKWCSVTKEGKKESSFHIQIVLPSGNEAEIVVRSLEYLEQPEICEIYGDLKKGLTHNELAKILKEYPLKKFVPS